MCGILRNSESRYFSVLITAGVGFKAEEPRDLAALILRVMKTEAKKFVNAQLLFQETINKRQAVLEPLIP